LQPLYHVLILTPTNFSAAMPTSTSVLDWVLSSNGRVASDHGGCALSLLPADDDVVLVLPPRLVSWHRVALPKVASARVRAALDGMLEDRLLDDPAELHLALEPGSRPGQTLWVAACNKAWLQAWLQALEAAGRPAARIVPALWPTSVGGSEHGETVHWAHDEGNRVWLSTASPLGVRSIPLRENGSSTFGATSRFGADSSFGPASTFGDSSFGSLGPSTGRGPEYTLTAASDPATTSWFADPSITGLAEQVCNQRFDLMPTADWLLRCAQSDWNLAQFDLRLSSGARRTQRMRQGWRHFASAAPWKPARWALVALVLTVLGGVNAMAWKERSALQAKQQAIRQTLQSTFPEVGLVLDAPVQMQRELTRLQQASGTLSAQDLEGMLAFIAATEPGASLSSIDFLSGEARLGIGGLPDDRLLALQQAMASRGWQVSSDSGMLNVQAKAP
jgi:general secretion pathway protein L